MTIQICTSSIIIIEFRCSKQNLPKLLFQVIIITFANNLETMHPRLRILHCFEYGKYGITPTIERADDVLQA